MTEIRRLVYALRPPVLDELGLLEALQAQAAQFGGHSRLQIQVAAQPDPLPPLSAAVEVAAYRIALEGMSNAVRHARAHRCDVCLCVVGNGRTYLQIEISDDGIGLPSSLESGVGLASMRERAEELGGRCGVTTVDNGGTRVTARLPLTLTNHSRRGNEDEDHSHFGG